jgi:predicted dienelactone hydrolase
VIDLGLPEVAAEVAHAGDDHSIPAVRAVFVLAPALVQALYPTSLAQMRMPVAIVLGDADTVAPPTTNGLVAAKLIPGADWNNFLASDTMISCPPAPKLDRRSFHNARPIFPRPIPTAMQSRQLRNSLVGTLRTIRDRAADRHKGAAVECPRAPTLPSSARAEARVGVSLAISIAIARVAAAFAYGTEESIDVKF